MAYCSEISDNGCLTIRLAIADRTYFDSNCHIQGGLQNGTFFVRLNFTKY